MGLLVANYYQGNYFAGVAKHCGGLLTSPPPTCGSNLVESRSSDHTGVIPELPRARGSSKIRRRAAYSAAGQVSANQAHTRNMSERSPQIRNIKRQPFFHAARRCSPMTQPPIGAMPRTSDHQRFSRFVGLEVERFECRGPQRVSSGRCDRMNRRERRQRGGHVPHGR